MWACITEQREAKWLQGEVQTLGMNNTAIEQGWLIPYIHMYMYVCMGWLVERESEREREREREPPKDDDSLSIHAYSRC